MVSLLYSFVRHANNCLLKKLRKVLAAVKREKSPESFSRSKFMNCAFWLTCFERGLSF
jgi:hypothetical protein